MAMAGPTLTATASTNILMTTDAILTLTQWLSPAYPVGSFAYSHGLEQAVADGRVSPETLCAWLCDILEHGAGQADATLIAAAYDTPDKAPEIDQIARAFAASAERLAETTRQGAAFCRTTSALWPSEDAALTYPVALGAAASREALPIGLTLKLYLHAFASNLVAAAQRLMPLGQTAAQAILKDLAMIIERVAANTEPDLSRLSSQSFASDITAMRHETLEPRIFAT